MTEKSILEQALLQVQTLEEAVKQNAKGILASTMKQELNDLLKESLEEEEETKDEEVDEQPETEVNPEEEEDDMSDTDTEEVDDTENDTNLDNVDPEAGNDSIETDSADAPELPDFGGGDDAIEDEDDVMDMTGASDEDVLKIFKAMKPEDGIVVKKDGDNVELDLDGDEYIIKLDGEGNDTPEFESEMGEPDLDNMGGPSDFDADNAGSDMSGLGDSEEEEEETLYEIELGDEEEEEMAEEDAKEVETTEAARTKSNPHGNKGGFNRAGLPSKKTYKAGSGVVGINEEVETLKKQNAEYKKALVLFKDKLNEVAVFNANLAYATRLFTEHSTTKQEKLNILKRFDTVATLTESKSLFNSIKSELGTKTTVTESVVEKISNTPSTSSSQEVLAEAKAYENPQFKRMKDLMSKMK
jgi:hypothetical protein